MQFDRLQPRGNKYNPAEYINMELNYSICAYIICYQEFGKTITTYWVKNIRHSKVLRCEIDCLIWYGTHISLAVGLRSLFVANQTEGGWERAVICESVRRLHHSGVRQQPLPWQHYLTGHCNEGRKEIFYLTTHSKHFIYGYMASGHCKVEPNKVKKITAI